ncbi:MAG: hypothetical protein ABSD49_14555 [Candidatus Bathyarchaeia archaeon]|jgi:hypothetical protein
MTVRFSILVIILAVMISFPLVHADPGSYVIPLESARWTSSTIQVYVSGGEAWQQNQTLQALQLWNQAQLWFNKEYFPNSSVYTFEVGDSSAPVQVTLLNSSTIVENILGWTDYRAQNGVMQSAKVRIAATNSRYAVLVLSAHELGHVLGLGDDVICCKEDLMNAFPITNNVSAFPTTLDLYALHVLATANSIPSFVWLSNEIPYETALPTPKFNGSPTMIRMSAPERHSPKNATL